MENDKTTNENKNEHPKPTDEVQKEIETVVPSAHKAEVTPGKPEKHNEAKDDPATDESEDKEAKQVTEGADQDEEKSSEAHESHTDQHETTESGEDNSDTEEGNDNKDQPASNNEDHGIETVTP